MAETMHNMMQLDTFDLRLLDALQSNARLTNAEIGERIGLSPSQCSRRRAILENAGVIKGYRADIAAQALGLRLLVFVQVRLATHSGGNAQRFRDLIALHDEVQEAYALMGKTDYMLKVVVADLERLSSFINTVLLQHESVARVRSALVMDRLKEASRLPLRSLP